MPPLIDLTGQKFGRLTVLGRAENHGKQTTWKCQCDCGNMVVVLGTNLKRNHHTESCGCLQRERTAKSNYKHGMTRTRIYRIWQAIQNRCYYPDNDNYPYYGGRGIKVCDEWLTFETFYEWSMANGYKENLTIDRINTDGNYEPSNCRWTDMKFQNRNKRNNRILTFRGQKRILAEWSEITGIPRLCIKQRVDNLGWSIEKALTTPIKDTGRRSK